MDQKYYFLSGFPRSGNTLLSSILNQNPNICCYSNSIVSEVLDTLENKQYTSEIFLNFPDYRCIENISKNIFKNYYSEINSKFIIDRSSWTSKQNLFLLKKYCPNEVKIIFLYRDILEILASFIKWSLENSTFLDKYETIEERCHFLMRRNGPIMRHYSVLDDLDLNKEESIIFINYHDIVLNTNNVVDEIYRFLDIQKYQHSFNDLQQYSVNGVMYDDTILGKNLHYVRKNIGFSGYTVDEYLPREIIFSYRNLSIDHFNVS